MWVIREQLASSACVSWHTHMWPNCGTNTPCDLSIFALQSSNYDRLNISIYMQIGCISFCRRNLSAFVPDGRNQFPFQYKMRISSNQNQIFLLEKGNSKLSGWGWNSKWIQSSHWHLNPGQLLLLVASLLLFITMQCNSITITEGFNCTILKRCQTSDSR